MKDQAQIKEAVTTPPMARARPPRPAGRTWAHALLAVVMLYLFISAIEVMGGGLKLLTRDPTADRFLKEQVFAFAQNPLSGLCVGVLVTSIVQSSSFTTSFTVGLVVARQITLAQAVPLIMGANIGTSVTNLLVSLGHVRRRREFRRALAGACVHDFFNLLSVVLLFPLEWRFKILSWPAAAFGNWLENAAFFTTDPKELNLVKFAVEPLANGISWFTSELLGMSLVAAGSVEAALGVVLLFVALWGLVKALRGVLLHRLSGLFERVLFTSPLRSYLVGLFTTAAVQSSSVTTSLVVPLVGSGVLRIKQIYPYTLGANLGTTVTAMLAALAKAAITPDPAAAAAGLAAAAAHMMFNLLGTAIFWPLQAIPISMAKSFARVASRRRVLVAVFLVLLFFVIPLTIIIVTKKLT